MERNLILAGVGGQGILTIAQAISTAALRRGWSVKQAEVHGMSQRGGAVYSHLRYADHELHSELIPLGECDLILSMEPLEALRYVQYLREGGGIVASTSTVVNISNYPPVEEVLGRIAEYRQHVLVDAPRLARAAGSLLAGNSVLVGAASVFLDFAPGEMEAVLADRFAAKGARVVEANAKAFGFGRAAVVAYRDALRRGAAPSAVRRWMNSMPPEGLLQPTPKLIAAVPSPMEEGVLSASEAHAAAQILETAIGQDREQLFEHEVYNLVEVVGAIAPPRHVFVPAEEPASVEELGRFPGDRVVLKLVSQDVVHKSDQGGVVFVPNQPQVVSSEISRLIERHRSAGAQVQGVLVVEFVEQARAGFGAELFVGIRASREFGPVIAAGLGGVDTEYLAARMKPGAAAAKALVMETTAEEFLDSFRQTAAYEVLSGKARGHTRVVSDGELLRCFRAFLALARHFCVDRGDAGPYLAELEVNPFAFVHERMVPLDGRGSLGAPVRSAPQRPAHKIASLLEPHSIALVGVSSTRMNFGRIILRNILDCGFDPAGLVVLKPGEKQVDGVRCVASVEDLPRRVDLLVVVSSAEGIPALMQETIDSGRVESVIVIPGAVGETEGSAAVQQQLREMLHASRQRPDEGPVILGGNCLGIRSRPGRYDTFFIPREKMNARRHDPVTRTALITQSGAFAITRISNLETLNPALAVTIGNQLDLTVSDLVRTVSRREDIDVIGVYMEGFNDLDGLAFVQAVEEACVAGKVVIFYKAGRTDRGRSATAGHTASIAGDYEVCVTAAAQAGAIVVDTFKEFEQLLEMATLFHRKKVNGRRIGVISNAGFEAVGMADAIHGARYELEMPPLSEAAAERIRTVLAEHRLDRLVAARNPLDLNPMANEKVYETCIRAMADDPGIDAVVVSVVPFTPELLTTPEEFRHSRSLAERLPAISNEISKPLVAVIDAGRPYDALARALRRAQVPVLPSCDQAIRSLGRYLCHRDDRPRERMVRTVETRRLVDALMEAYHESSA